MAVRSAHVRLLGRTEVVVDAVPPGRVQRYAVRRIGREERGFNPIEKSSNCGGIGGVAAQESMLAEDPEVARLDIDVGLVGD
jgi:hypothetical protein